jgi:hypothetical protein
MAEFEPNLSLRETSAAVFKCIGSVWEGYNQEVVPVLTVQEFWRVKVYLHSLLTCTPGRGEGMHVLPTLLPVPLITIE